MKETTELVLFIAAIASQTVESSNDDGGLEFADATDYIDELLQAPEALKGISKIPSEIRKSSHDDRSKMYKVISQKVQDITPAKIDNLIHCAEIIAYALDKAVIQFKASENSK